MRLDRWFKVHFPQLPYGLTAKLIRTGQVRINSKRAKPNSRLAVQDEIRVPPLDHLLSPNLVEKKTQISKQDKQKLHEWMVYEDDDIIVLNKPAGLAMQGGSKILKHLDALLEGFREEDQEKPRIVHRLDKETAGVVVVARHLAAARFLTQAFKEQAVKKTYWALVYGVPAQKNGTIELPLSKQAVHKGERIMVDHEQGRDAVTHYKVIDSRNGLSWLELQPSTGRMHQLRVHLAEIGTPIVGDKKYAAPQLRKKDGRSDSQLHLMARMLMVPLPGGKMKDFTVPLPDHMAQSWSELGFKEE